MASPSRRIAKVRTGMTAGMRVAAPVRMLNRVCSIVVGLYFLAIFFYLLNAAVVPLTLNGGWRGIADVIAVEPPEEFHPRCTGRLGGQGRDLAAGHFGGEIRRRGLDDLHLRTFVRCPALLDIGGNADAQRAGHHPAGEDDERAIRRRATSLRRLLAGGVGLEGGGFGDIDLHFWQGRQLLGGAGSNADSATRFMFDSMSWGKLLALYKASLA